MNAIKSIITRKSFWALTVVVALLIYHAPRLASSLPLF